MEWLLCMYVAHRSTKCAGCLGTRSFFQSCPHSLHYSNIVIELSIDHPLVFTPSHPIARHAFRQACNVPRLVPHWLVTHGSYVYIQCVCIPHLSIYVAAATCLNSGTHTNGHNTTLAYYRAQMTDTTNSAKAKAKASRYYRNMYHFSVPNSIILHATPSHKQTQ